MNELFNLSLTPEFKLFICFLIAGAIFVLYCWEPKKNEKAIKQIHNNINGIEIDPEEYKLDNKALVPPKYDDELLAHHGTLEELDEYIKELKRNNIHGVDRV